MPSAAAKRFQPLHAWYLILLMMAVIELSTSNVKTTATTRALHPNNLLPVFGHRRAIYVGGGDRHMTCKVLGRSVIEPSSAKMC